MISIKLPKFRAFFIGGSYNGKDMIVPRKSNFYALPVIKDCRLPLKEIGDEPPEEDAGAETDIYQLKSIRNLSTEAKFFNADFLDLCKAYRCTEACLIYKFVGKEDNK